jgi:hypothetical protein
MACASGIASSTVTILPPVNTRSAGGTGGCWYLAAAERAPMVKKRTRVNVDLLVKSAPRANGVDGKTEAFTTELTEIAE